MFPYDYRLGPLLLNGYGLMAAAGVFAAFLIQRWTAPQAGLRVKDTLDLSFWMLISGLLGARLFYVIFHWPRYKNAPLDEIFDYFGGGLMFQGGLLVSLIVAFLILKVRKTSFFRAGDALAPALSAGQALGRVGCFLAGCCHGRRAPEHFLLSVRFPAGGGAPAGVPLYPTELTESFGLLALTVFLLRRLSRRTSAPGSVFGHYLLWSGLLRFLVDFFRGDNRGPLLFGMAPTTYIAAGICLAGLVVLTRAASGRARPELPGAASRRTLSG